MVKILAGKCYIVVRLLSRLVEMIHMMLYEEEATELDRP